MEVEIFTRLRGSNQQIALNHDYQRIVRHHCERLDLPQVALVLFSADYLAGKNEGPPAAMSITKGIFFPDSGRPNTEKIPIISVNLTRSEGWSEEALEATIAHEFGHLVRGDCEKAKGWSRIWRLWVKGLSGYAMVSAHYSYLWEREYEADIYAACLVGRAAFQRMIDEVLHESVESTITHPCREKRHDNIERYFARLEALGGAVSI